MCTERRTNSIGMELRRIDPGAFEMGSSDGDADESPVHEVTITEGFEIAETPVTNAQYEQFHREHVAERGKRGLSVEDDEAVVNVSWHDAVAFCEWLSEVEGTTYRLPTEAEWEYACRADTTTPFHTGDTLDRAFYRHQEDEDERFTHPKPVSLTVGETPPNAWGLHDTHGIVEEWCHDWYGPYPDAPQTDPVGRESGPVKVTRGGSHNAAVRYLRSANRLGTLPEDRHWHIGFRPVCGEPPGSEPLSSSTLSGRSTGGDLDWSATGREEAFIEPPIPFVRFPEDPESIPMYPHNHQPAVTWCEDGELLAIWFSTVREHGREMVVLSSRFRQGSDEWDEPSVFFDVPDRNLTGCGLLNDGEGTLYHFNGLGETSDWANLALVLRTSGDDGRTWSHPRLIDPEHRYRNQVIDGAFTTDDGTIIQPCDAVSGGYGGTAVTISHDGHCWYDSGEYRAPPRFEDGEGGPWIAGIHAGVTQTEDGRLIALGRGDQIDGRMPMSISEDGGRTWTYTASPFPWISWGQRVVLRRLNEGPLLIVTFTDPSDHLDDPEGVVLRCPDGTERRAFGMFAAVSYDDGETWPDRRLLSTGETPIEYDGRGATGAFTMDMVHAEPKGYLAATQTPDDTIHLLSSGLHYRFNLPWIRGS